MHANVEDRGIKGECTPLMEAASAGHLDIVRLLVAHGADVNAQSTSGNSFIKINSVFVSRSKNKQIINVGKCNTRHHILLMYTRNIILEHKEFKN